MRCIKKRISNSENPVTVEILLLREESTFSKARTKEIKQTLGYNLVCEGIRENIAMLKMMNKQKGNSNTSIEIKQYTETPVNPLYWIDDICYVGFFWRGEFAAQQHQIKIDMKKKNELTKNIETHFDSIWENASPCDIIVK